MMAIYCLVQFVLLLGLGVQFLQTAMLMSLPAVVVYLVFLVGGLVVHGALLEGRRLARWFETARVVLFGAMPAISGLWLDGSDLPPALRWVCATVAAGSMVMLLLAWRTQPEIRKDEGLAMSGHTGA
jgi:hypothetical protein